MGTAVVTLVQLMMELVMKTAMVLKTVLTPMHLQLIHLLIPLLVMIPPLHLLATTLPPRHPHLTTHHHRLLHTIHQEHPQEHQQVMMELVQCLATHTFMFPQRVNPLFVSTSVTFTCLF